MRQSSASAFRLFSSQISSNIFSAVGVISSSSPQSGDDVVNLLSDVEILCSASCCVIKSSFNPSTDLLLLISMFVFWVAVAMAGVCQVVALFSSDVVPQLLKTSMSLRNWNSSAGSGKER